MKKIFLCLLTFSLLAQCGCSRIKGMDKESIITACYASKSDDTINYTFYVADLSSGGDEEKKGPAGHTPLTFTAKNFSEASRLFYESQGRYDIAHLSMMFVNLDYLKTMCKDDADYIKDELKISPLIKIMVTDQSPEQISEIVGKNYRGSFRQLSDSLFAGDRKKMVCTMSELYFSAKNNLLTASVPILAISEQGGIAKTEEIALYNSMAGCCVFDSYDCEIYASCIKKYGKSSRFIKLEISNAQIKAKLCGTSDENAKMKALANKYKALGFDILNVMYFSKKCFMTYGAYSDFISKTAIGDVSFV